uniref:Uncharacterized protein n=1 Tax=Rhizophora mucronata TaxID=61149 RepID=A0A2P2MFN9_RHIMU
MKACILIWKKARFMLFTTDGVSVGLKLRTVD